MQIAFNKKTITALEAPDPSGKQKLHWVEKAHGLAVLCSGKTEAKSFVVQVDLPGGRTRRVTIGPVDIFDDLAEVKTRANKLIAQMLEGKDPKAGRSGKAAATLREVLTAFIEERDDLAETTRHDYRTTLERYVSDWFDRPLRDIDEEMIRERFKRIQKQVEHDHQRPVDAPVPAIPVTGRHAAASCMRNLRALWNWWKEEHCKDFPPHPVRLGRHIHKMLGKRRTRLVQADQMKLFFEAVDNLPNRCASDYLKLLLFTGLRRTEAASLLWSDIDLKAGLIRIPAERTKSRRQFDLPMTDIVRDLLIARRALGVESKYIFASDGRNGYIAEPRYPLTLVRIACGIEVSAHDLRRSFASVCEQVDISGLAVKKLLNHAASSDVTEGYQLVSLEQVRVAAQKVADRMKMLCGIAEPVGITKLAS